MADVRVILYRVIYYVTSNRYSSNDLNPLANNFTDIF